MTETQGNGVTDSFVADTVEPLTAQVVQLVTECVTLLRTPPPSEWQALAERVRETYEQVQQRIPAVASDPPPRDDTIDWTALATVAEEKDDGEENSRQLVFRVILPLFYALGTCYALLDSLPEPAKLEQEDKKEDDAPRRVQRSRRPKPPPGLLSMQQYTDVAALLEVCMVVSLVPLLDANILTPVSDRLRYQIPKAIQGRLNVQTLLRWSRGDGQEDAFQRCQELYLTVAVVGRLLLLDRFRPMLLPRHLADLYAGMFQVEQLSMSSSILATTESSPLWTLYQETCRQLLPAASEDAATTTGSPLLQARAYQTLLLQGTRAPLWLRRRVSTLLSELSTTNLEAVVRVFVLQAGRNDQTAAAARLAQALVTGEPSDTYYEALCDQLFVLVDQVVLTQNQKADAAVDEQIRLEDVTNLQLVWSVLDQLPESILQGPFWQRLSQDVVSAESTIPLHRMVRRVRVLFSAMPTSMNANRLCRLILSPIVMSTAEPGRQPMTLWSLILRAACVPAVLKSQLRQDAVVAFSCVLYALTCSTFTAADTTTKASGVDVAASALVYALAPNDWDVAGNRLVLDDESSSPQDDKYQCVRIENDNVDAQRMAEDMERRAQTIIRDVLLPLLPSVEKENAETSDRSPIEDLPSRLLQVLLSIYCAFGVSNAVDELGQSLPEVFCDESYVMVALTALPVLCEECPPDYLLSDGSGESAALFGIMIVVFRSINRQASSELATSKASSTVDKEQAPDGRFMTGASVLREIVSGQVHPNSTNDGARAIDAGGDEVIVSISSILLSLLIGILELGTSQRSNVEEATLRSFLEILRPLADGHEASQERSVAWTGMAEMASHAMALIAARGVPTSEGTVEDEKNGNILEQKIAQAEEDLKSTEPPIRARGAVTLRHVANSLDTAKSVASPTIMVLEEASDSAATEDVLFRVMRMAIGALSDSESYVYLAAIQTISAVADVQPAVTVPLLGMIVASGRCEIPNSLPIEASPEERIKLTEALIFAIRRRSAVSTYTQFLIDLMVFGPQTSNPKVSPVAAALDVQRETHSYFVHGSEPNQDDEDPSNVAEPREEQDLRLSTGGPLFVSEESDMVRAGIVNVVTELLAVDAPSRSVRYVPALVSTAIDTLRFDASRPVRRAGAMLAREIYGSLVREQDEVLASSPETVMEQSIPFAVAMVSAQEEQLVVTLERCVSGDNIADFNDEGRLYDPATVARCEEAIAFRRQSEMGGILKAARLVREQSDESNPVARMLRGQSTSIDQQFLIQSSSDQMQ